jgi:hypothetical protein
MKSSEFLKKAKALIDTPSKWTTGAWAKNAAGTHVMPENPGSVCFCTTGAMFRIEHDLNLHDVTLNKAVEYVKGAMNTRHIPDFNDSHTHAEVMAAWENAISTAESKGD